MRGATFHPRAPGLRDVLVTLALGVLAFPLALALFIGYLVSGGINERPITRFVSVNAELRRAVASDGGGGLVMKENYRAPDWLKLVVVGKDRRIVWSNLDGFAKDADFEVSRLELLAARPRGSSALGGEAPCFYADRVEIRGVSLGSFYAFVPPVDLRHADSRVAAYVRFVVVAALSIFAILAGVAISTLLARAVMRLERAAGAIASGDLESPVRVKGVREIKALAAAMESMRLGLREDRDRRARFLAAVSHDLRTPLTAIGGYLEAVEDGLAADPETLERYIGIMQGKTRLLEGRIQGLLEFARMETGEWRRGFERLELGPFLEGLAQELAEDASLADRRLVWAVGAASGLVVLADIQLVRRAFENILANALRYGPAGSAVTFHARRGQAGHGVGLLVEVDDEGPGIPEADRERIFEPFYRASAAREGEGNGLGLYIARSVLEGHGWRIDASASPSGGARFTVFVPRSAWL